MRATTAPTGVCPVCWHTLVEFAPGPGGRLNARCPSCQALERHRFLAIVLGAWIGSAGTSGAVLDVAPTRAVTRALSEVAASRVMRIDFDPDADGREVDVRASLSALPLPDSSIEILICSNVLEHVPDDATAMRELARVLSPDGLAVVKVPFRPDAPTDEAPHPPEEERIRRFGQADHVRYYGRDLEDRLTAAGLWHHRLVPVDLVVERGVGLMGMAPLELVWVVGAAKGGAASARADVAALRAESWAGTVAMLVKQLADARRASVRSAPALVPARPGTQVALRSPMERRARAAIERLAPEVRSVFRRVLKTFRRVRVRVAGSTDRAAR
jgi:SAM-dependent methyltransferase